MTIHISRPEVEAIINERLQSGAFQDAEDVILQALAFPRHSLIRARREKALLKYAPWSGA
jgi:hypothetical protein